MKVVVVVVGWGWGIGTQKKCTMQYGNMLHFLQVTKQLDPIPSFITHQYLYITITDLVTKSSIKS